MKYAAGDAVQCYWDSIKFQARIVRVDAARSKTPYLVHYQGWKNRWDEWVEESRLVGRGSGAKKKASSKAPALPKAKAAAAASPMPPEDEVDEEMLEPTPTLERTIEGKKIVYKLAEGKSLKSLTEVRRFCTSHGLIFDAADYDFSPPLPPAAVPKSKSPKGKRRSELEEELVTVEVSGPPSPSTNLLEQGHLGPDHPPPPPRGLKTAGAGALSPRGKAKRRRSSPKAPPMRMAEPVAFPVYAEEEETQVLTEMLADIGAGRGEEAEEFIEIQAPDEAGVPDDAPPVLDPISHHPPMEEAGTPNRPRKPRKLQSPPAQPPQLQRKRPAQASVDRFEPIDYTNLIGASGLGMEDLEGLTAYGRGATPPTHLIHQAPAASSSSMALNGIRVTGLAPAHDAPSRVFMKLRPPESKGGKNRFRASVRVGPEGCEYLDSSYSPTVHTGGRGRFGVVGGGPPPTPIEIDRPEDFHYLPPEVVGDHCYGKSTAGGTSSTTTTVGGRRIPAHLLPTAPNPTRIQSVRLVHPVSVHGPSEPRHAFQTISFTPLRDAHMVGGVHYYDDGLGEEVVAGTGGMDVYESGGGYVEDPPHLVYQPQPMLNDKLPANILEGVDDPEMDSLR